MSQFTETGIKAFPAGGAVAQYLRVKTPTALAAAGAADVELGTIEQEAFASGDICAVRLRTAPGTCFMVAAGAIAAGAEVYAAAAGKINDVVGKYKIGVALSAATADGDIIEVMRSPAMAAGIWDEIADPGDGGAIPVVASGHCPLVTEGAETRTLAIPTFVGQMLLLHMKADGGNGVVTVAGNVNATGNDTLTFADTTDAILLVAVDNDGTLCWRNLGHDGVALSTA